MKSTCSENSACSRSLKVIAHVANQKVVYESDV